MVHGQVTWTCARGVPSWQPPLKRCVMSDEQEQDSSPLIPTEQQTIMFCQEPILLRGMGLRKGCRMATPD